MTYLPSDWELDGWQFHPDSLSRNERWFWKGTVAKPESELAQIYDDKRLTAKSGLKVKVLLYGAGRISRCDWRNILIGSDRIDAGYYADGSRNGERCCVPDIHNMPQWVSVATIFPNVDYVGPFFFSCDHGGGHGDNDHGVARSSFSDTEHGGSAETVRRCLEAIRQADVVFAWLTPGAYGTAAEIGYARALGKKVVAAHSGNIGDLWFAGAMANEIIVALDPIEALKRLFSPPDISEGVCESPVEKLMFKSFAKLGVWEKDEIGASCVIDSLQIRAQFEVLSYRLDFAILPVKIAVEVDGHDWHERTKEQAARDKSRDRALVIDGWSVMRFTGSEVFRDADKCVDEVLKCARSRSRSAR